MMPGCFDFLALALRVERQSRQPGVESLSYSVAIRNDTIQYLRALES